MSSPAVCRGSGCDCEYYQPNPNPSLGEKVLCIECLHGKSKHPADPSPNLGLVGSTQAPGPTAGKGRVMALFNSIKSTTQGSGKESKTSLTSKAEAEKETLAGFRPESSAGSSRSGGPRPSKRDGDRTIQQGTGKRVLKNDLAPAQTILANIEMHGCAIIRDSSKSPQEDLAVDSKWTVNQTDQFLRKVFPHVFDHLDTLSTAGPSGKMKQGSKCGWVLCCREKGKLNPVPGLQNPDGSDLARYKGHESAGLRQSHIYIGELRVLAWLSGWILTRT
ncbi:hypothetical protein HWV62_319 [Athelia sp. TMB]|nr:hypothetical protein HWV62_319 [Athelia sp. TMB]